MAKEIDAFDFAAKRNWMFHAKAAGFVSALYIWSYYLTVAIVAPIQQELLPAVVMSLVFFPHGVRVLAAWLYGWRSFLYLLPGALLCNFHFAGEAALSLASLSAMTASLVAAPLAFNLARKLFPALTTSPGKTNLRTVMLVGFLASAFNLAGLQAIHSLYPIEGAVIFIGDTNGLILSLAMVWLVLKLVAKRI
jgi:hypothetical protein